MRSYVVSIGLTGRLGVGIILYLIDLYYLYCRRYFSRSASGSGERTNINIESQKKQQKQATTRTQQLQKPWLLTVNKLSHMLSHSGSPRDGDIEVVVV